MVGWRFPPFSRGFVWRLKAHLHFFGNRKGRYLLVSPPKVYSFAKSLRMWETSPLGGASGKPDVDFTSPLKGEVR